MSEPKIIYNFNPETKELLGQTQARKSPLEEDVYLIPAHATDIEPPEVPEGKKAVWNDGVWDLENISEPEPEPVLEDVIADKIQELKTVYYSKVSGGFTFEGNLYQIRDIDRINMVSVMADFNGGATNAHGGFWRTMDNQMIAMTDAKVQEFILAAKAYVASLFQSNWTHADAINALTDISAVEAYDVTTGWAV